MSGPGSRLYVLARYVCSPATIARFIDPWIADFQFEYSAASGPRAAWTRVVHSVAFARLIALGVLTADAPSTMRLLAWMAGCVTLTTFLFTVPLQANWWASPRIYVLLIPQALGIGIPLGAALGAAFGVRCGRVTKELRALVFVLAWAAAIGNGFLSAVWLPKANQAFRVESFRLVTGKPDATPLKGPNELTLGELRGEVQRLEHTSASNLNPMRSILHTRAALGVLPLTLVLCSFALASRYRRGWALALIVIVSELACFSFRSQRSDVAPLVVELEVWIPTFIPLAIALAARLGGATETAAS
jgi:hypothetical protein